MSDIERIIVNDYKALGQLFIDWALNPMNRPKTLDEFKGKTVTPKILEPLPSYIYGFTCVQSHQEVLLLRLPPADLVQDTLKSIQQGEPYLEPTFYKKRCPGSTDPILDKDMFPHRVGDYVIAHCV